MPLVITKIGPKRTSPQSISKIGPDLLRSDATASGGTATRNLFVGSSEVTNVQIGSTLINEVYVGSTLMWSRS